MNLVGGQKHGPIESRYFTDVLFISYLVVMTDSVAKRVQIQNPTLFAKKQCS
jgi:hypothetical protein